MALVLLYEYFRLSRLCAALNTPAGSDLIAALGLFRNQSRVSAEIQHSWRILILCIANTAQ